MTDATKAMRLMLLGAIERAVVTSIELEGPDGLQLDASLAEAAGFFEHEKLDVLDVTTGNRFACQVRFAKPESGDVGFTGASAHLVKPGELVSLASFGWMKAKAAAKHQPRIVTVDDENHA